MQVNKAVYFSISVEDQPGALADLITLLKENRVELAGMWGFGIGEGKAQIIFVPVDPISFRNVVVRSTFAVLEGECVHVSDSNSAEALHSVLTIVASKGVNIHALDAMCGSGGFGCYMWSEESRIDEIVRLISSS